LPPEFIEALDNMVKADLLNWRDAWFHCLLWSTGAVAIGLFFEGPELWHEIRHILMDRRDRRMFFALTSHEVPPRWKVLAFVGWIMIAVGVAGEGIFEAMVSRADGQVQTFNDILHKMRGMKRNLRKSGPVVHINEQLKQTEKRHN
jgi:hypothetical protein